MEAMTLAQVYVALRNNANDLQEAGTMPILAERLHSLADAIDAHLAQPAQAVDVDDLMPLEQMLATVKEARMHMDGRLNSQGCREITDRRLSELHDAIVAMSRALSGEKAGPAGDGYYLQDSRSFVGNDMLFWCADRNGYTTDLRRAGVYTLEEALRQQSSRSTDIPWPKAYIDAKARPAVDFQHVDREDVIPASPTPDKEGQP